MTQKSGLFNSVAGDRAYTDTDVADYLSLLTHGYGVLAGYENELTVTEGTGLQVLVDTGGVWLGEPSGWYYINDSVVVLDLDAEVSGVSRIDRIVVKLDKNTDIRAVQLAVVKGIANASPAVPSLTQNEMVFEIPLAQVLVTGGSMDIEVTDERKYLQTGNRVNFGEKISGTKGYCGLIVNNVFTADQRGIGVYDGEYLVTSGICRLSGLTAGKNYYAQSDGSIGVTINDYKIGHAVSGDKLLVNIDGSWGVDAEYTDNMVNYYAMPHTSGSTRHNFQLPSTADGALLKYKTTAWLETDDETDGTLIANITDDTGLYGDNGWYETSGETNSETRYYKCFPYKGSMYNTTYGENIGTTIVGILINEYTFDHVSGSTVYDDAGSNTAYMTNGVITTGDVGNAMSGTGNTYASLNSTISTPGKSCSFKIYYDGAHEAVGFGAHGVGNPFCKITAAGQVQAGHRNTSNGSYYIITTTVSAGWHTVAIDFYSSYLTLWVDGVIIGNASYNNPNSTNMTRIAQCNLGTTTSILQNLYGRIDQFRIYSRNLIQALINELEKE